MPVPLRQIACTTIAGLLLVPLGRIQATPTPQQTEEVQVIQGPAAPTVPRDLAPMPAAPQVAGTAVVDGVVVSADLGRPVRRATVRLTSASHGLPFTTMSDDAGRFRFEAIPAGQFRLSVSKPGYLESAYGERQAGNGRPGTPLSITSGQRLERLTMPIARGGVLAGLVADDGGEPAFNTEVRAFRFVWQNGQRVLRPAGSARADDRGSYRIGALPPGEYVVMATPAGDSGFADVMGFPALPVGLGRARTDLVTDSAPSGTQSPSTGYAPVFFPGTTSSRDALRVTLGISEERGGLDVVLPFVAMGRITGAIVNDGDGPLAGIEVRLTDVDLAVPGLGTRATGTGPDGRFFFDKVPPGRYRLTAESGPRKIVLVDESNGATRVTMQFTSQAVRAEGPGELQGGPALVANRAQTTWARAELSVTESSTEDVTLVLQPGLSVSGRVAFDGSDQPPADLSAIRVVLNSANPEDAGRSSADATVTDNGEFTISGITPGTYRVSVLTGSAWRAKALDVGGRDALDDLLTVDAADRITDARLTLTTRTGSLSGTLVDATGHAAPGYTIVLFADDPTYWTPYSRRIRAVRPSTDGRFSIGGLPAGTYRLVAVDDIEEGRWFDPQVLQVLAGAALRIDLGDGEERRQDLRVGP